MKLKDAKPRLEEAVDVEFEELFKERPNGWRRNKGKIGQLLELYLEMSLSSDLTDFDDGELKTNKAKRYPKGYPAETMYILQISSIVDTLVGPNPTDFVNSKLYRKIRNLIYLPVVKTGKEKKWYFADCIHIKIEPNTPLFNALEMDYNQISKEMRKKCENGLKLHTVSGKYIQIRTKDSKPYTPIYSKHYSHQLSDKNRAFYFKKRFMREAVERSLPRGTLTKK